MSVDWIYSHECEPDTLADPLPVSDIVTLDHFAHLMTLVGDRVSLAPAVISAANTPALASLSLVPSDRVGHVRSLSSCAEVIAVRSTYSLRLSLLCSLFSFILFSLFSFLFSLLPRLFFLLFSALSFSSFFPNLCPLPRSSLVLFFFAVSLLVSLPFSPRSLSLLSLSPYLTFPSQCHCSLARRHPEHPSRLRDPP